MATIETYRPAIRDADWKAIRPFVTDTVTALQGRVSYAPEVLFHVVTHHAHWAHLVAGMPLDCAIIFRRDVIGYSVSMMPTRSPSTMGKTRSVLLRVGECLGTVEIADPLPKLAPADPSEPYTPVDVDQLRSWAYFQRDAAQRASAQALLALGLGAGLPTRDLARVRGVDVDVTACTVRVAAGTFPRLITVAEAWAEDLAEVVEFAGRSHLTLFRPGVVFHKNTVLTFVQRSIGVGLVPTTQRMRVTWLVDQLSTGVPMQDLLFAAGVKSMDALVRYQRFLPSPVLAGAQGSPPRTQASL